MASASKKSSKSAKSQVYSREKPEKAAGDEDTESDDDDLDDDDDVDIFSPEFVKSRVANMPELVELIKDPEVLAHINNPNVTAYLREISLDPSKIPSLLDKPEIQFLKKKMEDLVKKTYPDAKVPI